MQTTQCLRDEHKLILRILDCFEIALVNASEASAASAEVFDPFVIFFKGFADRCHHCKEEDQLFPTLEKQGIPREGGPIGIMLHEHEMGRYHVKEIAKNLPAANNGDADAIQAVIRQGYAFLSLLKNHITKEDHVLFNMADQLVQGDDQTQLLEAYRAAEETDEYCKTIADCLAIAEELTARYGIAMP